MTTAGLLASHAYLERRTVRETRIVVPDLCRHFYGLSGVTGMGGSITIKAHDDAVTKAAQLIVMSPSEFQKERMVPEDMYVLASSGQVLSARSPKPYPHKPPKCTDSATLFIKTYQMQNAGAVIHSHGRESCLVTMLHPLEKELKAECYHYLFDAALNLHQLGVNYTTPNHGPIGSAKPFQGKDSHIIASVKAGTQSGSHVLEPSRCIVLDIEGTTTPISFVADVLFPYARDNVRKHLISAYDTRETKEDIELLRLQVEDDLKKGILGAVPIPSDDAGKEAVIDSLVSNVEAMIKADRKITSLKQLQGHIWRTGFENKELQGIVYEDVPEALERWHANGVKVYIYSSGSREAQRLIFGNTTYGDLRKYLCGFFDTAVGNKRESRSYFEIFQSVGVDKPSQILFVTDVYQEAVAAKAAGLEVLISLRPGNAPLPDNHGFQTISSFAEI